MSQTTPEDGHRGLDALAQVTRVVDGDTWVGYRRPEPLNTIGPAKYRLLGADTHETDADDPDLRERGHKEEQFTRQWIAEAQRDWDVDEWPFRILYPREADVQGRGAFGRILVDLQRRSDHERLSKVLHEHFDDITYEG